MHADPMRLRASYKMWTPILFSIQSINSTNYDKNMTFSEHIWQWRIKFCFLITVINYV